ncbi:glycosyltransferase family 2 protein [Vibrio metschnikovii]|uniref:glycosyltransferase family 2 protein n=1 Tax=Vibrio metschnikovii TaxID=28172 RepID=UPI0013028A1C|nr:glycosyltransferase family 2 protein [Vibrio metschnikovii]
MSSKTPSQPLIFSAIKPQKILSINKQQRYHGSIQAQLRTRHWHLIENNQQTLTLRTHRPSTGWHRLTIKYHATPSDLLQNTVLLELGQDQASLTLIEEKPGKLGLIFYCPTPIKQLRLHWPTLSAQLTPSINIKIIPQVRAYWQMINLVSRRDKAEGGDWQRIYRLTRARQKRVSKPFALERLMQTYHPMLITHKLHQSPYLYWQQHFQPSMTTNHPPRTTPMVAWLTLPDNLLLENGKLLQRTAQSLIKQTHQHWQLNLVINAEIPSWLGALLKVIDDPRITIITTADADISADAWHCFLQLGDTWSSHALARIAEQATHHCQAQLIYSDHDEFNAIQTRQNPAFKPDWNPDLLKSHNYIGRAVFFNGQQLNHTWLNQPQHLRCLKAGFSGPNPAENGIHLPEILFHQAYSANKVPSMTERQQVQQGLKQLTAHHAHRIVRVVFDKKHQVYHPIYRVPTPHPLVSIIIPTRNGLAITRQCVESILRLTSYPHYQIIIVNNQSDCPQTLAWFSEISQHPTIQVLDFDADFNYSAINNFAVQHSQGELVCLLNNDTEIIHSSWLTEMVRQASRPEIGCVGATLLFFDNTVQHAGIILGIWGLAGHAHKHYSIHSSGYQKRLVCTQNYSAVTAACLMVKRSIYQQIGGLDEQLTVAFNDVDFCLKVQQAGYHNLWTPRAMLYHYESKSRGKDDTPAKQAREQQEIALMRQRWQSLIQHDPHYSRHLTRHREDFTLRLEEHHFEVEALSEKPLP